MELRLLGSQRDVLAELSQKLALTTAETIGRASRQDQRAESRLLYVQRRDYRAMKTRIHQRAYRGDARFSHVGHIDQFAAREGRSVRPGGCAALGVVQHEAGCDGVRLRTERRSSPRRRTG